MRWPGIEPRSTAWKAAMLTITPPTLQLLGINLKSIIFAVSEVSNPNMLVVFANIIASHMCHELFFPGNLKEGISCIKLQTLIYLFLDFLFFD